ncbi:MAG: FAD-dependent oxidoreductase [Blastocatellia bacterium]
MQKYDLLVIGSGPGGQRAAIQGAKLGKRVALMEKREVFGGTCINAGTIPSKTMREAVLHLSGYQYQNVYGMNYRVKEKITIADLSFRVQHVIKTECDVTQAQLTRNNIDLHNGMASFVDAHRVKVELAAARRRTEAEKHHRRRRHAPAVSETVPINSRTIINSDQIFC